MTNEIAQTRIVVVGSINMDLVTRVRRLPRPGETVHGREFREIPGGKGANQAVAAARLGAHCSLIGRIGDDGFGSCLVASLESVGVETGLIAVSSNCASGVAVIGVEDGGENSITIVAGANGQLSVEDVHNAESEIAAADALLLQLEIPMKTVEAALALAIRHGVRTTLDPAPAPDSLPASLFDVDVLCPNETEAETITGLPVSGPLEAERAARELLARGVRHPIITLGAGGAMLCGNDGCELVPAPVVETVDTTAAGDAFAAAVTVALAEGASHREAVRFGNAAGAAAATRFGAQTGMPDRALVSELAMRDPDAAKA